MTLSFISVNSTFYYCHSHEGGNLKNKIPVFTGMTYTFSMNQYFVYMMASKKEGVLYIGVTSDLVKRVYEHKNSLIPNCFTDKYLVKTLIYFEIHNSVEEAILREKRIKKWNREWKINLIEKENPAWNDLYLDIL